MKKSMLYFFIIIGVIVTLYIIMYFNTNSVVDKVKNIMLGNVDVSETAETPLRRYNNSDILENAKVKVNITRLFTLHNFFDGYMWVIYSYETLENDSDIKPGTWNVISRWKIHRENGEWQIIDISESP